MKNNIIVFCPNPYSLYTNSVCELLLRDGITIDAIIVKKFTTERFFSEFKRDGNRLILKIWNKLILRGRAYNKYKDTYTILDFCKDHHLNIKNVDELGKKHSIEVIRTNDFNTPQIEQKIKSLSPQLAVFTGGGLIRENIIIQCNKGIINCHMGWLPEYRGMDVVEWPLLRKDFETIGFTTHLMDNGVDTGPILRRQKVSAKGQASIQNLRMHFEPLMVQELVDTVKEVLNESIVPFKQEKNEGKQYFIMHPKLADMAQQSLQQYNIAQN